MSILHTLSKIMKKILGSQIRLHSGKSSILTALAFVTNDIFRTLDNSNLCVLILLDYSKAFDLLNDDILITILLL